MAEDIGALGVSIGMDASGFTTGMTQINRNLKTLNSEFKMNTAAIGLNGTALDRLKLKSSNLSSAMVQQQNKVNALEAAYDRSVTATGRDSAATQNLEQRLNLARASLSNMGNTLTTTNVQIAIQSSRWTVAGNAMVSAGTSINNVGTKIKTVGSNITKVGATITTAFGLVGAGSLKAYEEVKTGTNEIARLTGATGKQFEDLKGIYEDVARESANSFEDIGIAVGSVSVRLNLTGNELKQASLDFMKFAKVNKVDVTTSVALVSRAMGDAGIKTTEYKEVLDLLTMASQKSGIKVDVLSESLAKYGAPMRALGFDTKESIALFSGWEKAGVNTELAFGGMKKAIGNWGKAGKDSGVEFKKVLKDIQNTPTLAAATTKAIEIFGIKAGPDLADAIKGGRFAYEDFLKILENSKGTVDSTAKNMTSYTAEMKKAWHSVTLASAELGESVAKELAPIMKDVASTIKDLTKRWDSLDDSTKASIAKFGLITIAIGGVATVLGGVVIGIGGFVSGIGGIVSMAGGAIAAIGGIGTATTGIGAAGVAGATGLGAAGLAGGLGAAVIAAAPFVVAGAAIVGTGYLIKKSMDEEVIPKVNLFADSVVTTSKQIKDANGQIVISYDTTVTKIGEGTKKAVESYLALDKGSTDALNKLYLNSTTITGQIVTDVSGKYNAMNETVKIAIDKRFADEYKTMTEFYGKSEVLTKIEEEKALLKMKSDNVAEKAEEDKATKEILAIYQKSKDENRALTLAEEEAIKVIQNRKKTTAITVLSASEAESKVILDRMKAYGTRVTAEQAGKEIENANKSRDGTIKAANEQYDKTVKAIKATYDESTPQGKKMADSLIKDAERQKLMTIEQAQIMRSGVVGKIMSMNSENEGKIDESTGKIIKTLDKIKAWFKDPTGTNKTYTITTKYVSLGDKTAAVAKDKNLNPYLLYTPIKTKWTGDKNFDGGLTTLHERGYEVYNLNKGSQILNHEASLDLMTKTAQEVAKGVLANSQGNKNGNELSLNIENFVNARQQDVAALAVELQYYLKQQNLGRG